MSAKCRFAQACCLNEPSSSQSSLATSTVPEGGADRLVMKRLARTFQPGEDRLAGLETVEGELTGAPVLKVANAFLECQVRSRWREREVGQCKQCPVQVVGLNETLHEPEMSHRPRFLLVIFSGGQQDGGWRSLAGICQCAVWEGCE